jgi:hypothetical protein
MAQWLKERESKIGRSVYGDFMDDDLNEHIYGLLLEASDKIQEVLVILRDHADDPCDGGNSYYQMGVFSSAQALLDDQVDPDDYPPLAKRFEERRNEKLLWAIRKAEQKD